MHFRERPVTLGRVHNVTLVPMGDFAGLFDYFYEVNLIGVPLFSSTFSLFPLLPDFSM